MREAVSARLQTNLAGGGEGSCGLQERGWSSRGFFDSRDQAVAGGSGRGLLHLQLCSNRKCTQRMSSMQESAVITLN